MRRQSSACPLERLPFALSRKIGASHFNAFARAIRELLLS